MTDVRSLLRNERASRRIVHPQATYSTTGTLVCLVCHIQLKAESQWEKHLLSAQHAMRLQRIRDGTLGRPPGAPPPPVEESLNGGGNKKRKADDGEERAKKRRVQFEQQIVPEEPVQGDSDAATAAAAAQDSGQGGCPDGEGLLIETANLIPHPRPEPFKVPPTTPSNDALTTKNTGSGTDLPTTSNNHQTIDEDEWAAFEREVATPPPTTTSLLMSEATISAAPLSAAEIAAQEREQANVQKRERMEAVVEGEREDAARRLEDEFEEMAGLEEKVRRLREQREQLRKEIKRGDEDARMMSEDGNDADVDVGDDSASEDEVDDEWDSWGRLG